MQEPINTMKEHSQNKQETIQTQFKQPLVMKRMQDSKSTPRPKKSERMLTPDITEEKNL